MTVCVKHCYTDETSALLIKPSVGVGLSFQRGQALFDFRQKIGVPTQLTSEKRQRGIKKWPLTFVNSRFLP